MSTIPILSGSLPAVLGQSVQPVISVWAPSTASPVINNTAIPVGATIRFDLNITDSPEILAFDVKVVYDFSVLSFIGHDFTGTVLEGWNLIVTPRSPELRLRGFGTVPFPGGSGTLVHLDFQVLKQGVTPLALSETLVGQVGVGSVLAEVAENGYFTNTAMLGPVVDFTHNPSNPIKGDEVVFDASSSFDPIDPITTQPGIARFTWSFGDGSGQTTTDLVVRRIFGGELDPKSGTFWVRLIATDNDGNIGMKIQKVIVSPGPPSFDFRLSMSPSNGTVTVGSNITTRLTVTLVSGASQIVMFRLFAPIGIRAEFSPSGCLPSCESNVTIFANPEATPGTFVILVEGSGGGVTDVESFLLTVLPSVEPPPVGGEVPDPRGDTFGFGAVQLDVESISAVSDGAHLIFTLNFFTTISPPSGGQANSVVGYIDIDADQNPFTGITSFQTIFGQTPPSGLGDEYVISLFFEADVPGRVGVFDAVRGMFAGTAPVTFSATALKVEVPLELIGFAEEVNYGTIIGTFSEPTDEAPNICCATSTLLGPRLQIGLSPAEGPVGTHVLLQGVNATAEGIVEIFFGTFDPVAGNQTLIQLGTVVADAAGSFTFGFTVPPATAGRHTIFAVDTATGRRARADFTIVPELLLTPNRGPIGTMVTARGTGFSPGLAEVFFDDMPVALGLEVEPTGSFTIVFNIPISQPGPHQVRAVTLGPIIGPSPAPGLVSSSAVFTVIDTTPLTVVADTGTVFSTGDKLDLFVQTSLHGAAVDATELVVTLRGPDGTTLTLETVRIGLGLYKVSIIAPEEIGTYIFEVRSSLVTETVESRGVAIKAFEVREVRGFADRRLGIRVGVGAVYFPGDSAEIYLLADLDGSLDGLENLQLKAVLVGPDGTTTGLVMEKMSQGLFKATFTIPRTKSLGTYAILARAQLGDLDAVGLAGFEVKPTWISREAPRIASAAVAAVGIASVAFVAWRKGYLRRRNEDTSSSPSFDL